MNTSETSDRSVEGDDLANEASPAESPVDEAAIDDEEVAVEAEPPMDAALDESAAEDDQAASEEPDEEAAEEEPDEEVASSQADGAKPEPEGMEWYVLKVQSNRENSIRDAIVRRIKIAGLEHLVADVVVPTEKVTEMKGGKKRVMERKFYPGYIIIRLILDEDTWFTIRETPGVGDFVGSGGKPVAMTAEDVARMLGRKEKAEEEKQPRLQINFEKGDRVKIKEGAFENFEGEVDEVIESKGLVRVMVQVFGRPTPVEVEYWQVEPV